MRAWLFLLVCLSLLASQAKDAEAKKAPKAGTAKAAPAQNRAVELWSLSFGDASPVAAFFDAAQGDLVVSLRERNGSRLDRVSLEGKLGKKAYARGKGEAGALRAGGGKVYWIAGDEVLSVDGETLTMGRVPKELGEATDIAVSGKGEIYLGMSSGALYRMQAEREGSVLLRGSPIRGLFLLQDTLYLLQGANLQRLGLGLDTDLPAASAMKNFCSGICLGLERSSSGLWITTQGGDVLAANSQDRRVLLHAGGARLGRPAYVYRKEPAEDFFVLPFPDEHLLRAYRMPGWK